jgi:small subunit ribosomal protein S16
MGTKKKPAYRVILMDESRAPSSKEVENIGEYDPCKNPAIFKVKKDRVEYWLSKGAQPTDKLRILFGKAGFMSPVDLTKLNKKKSKSEAKPAEEATAAAPAPAEAKKEA